MNKLFARFLPIGVIIFLVGLLGAPLAGGNMPFPGSYLATFFTPWSATYAMPVKNNAMPDVITQIYPWKRVTMDSWKQGQLPLWNPYSFSGTSHVGTYQTAIFSPVNLLFLLSEKLGWSILILLQPLLAGIGMYLFLARRNLTIEARLLGSIAFMFCGFMTVWMAYGTLGYAVLFLPYALLGIDMLTVEGNRRGGIITAVAIALSFLSGHFQMSLYVLLFVAGYLVFLSYEKNNRNRFPIAVSAVLLGVLIAAPQILAGFMAYTEAVRSSLFIKGEVIPWQYLPTIVAPDFYGNPVTRNDWFGHYAEWASYVGIAPLFFAIMAIAVRRTVRAIRFFAGMAVLSLFLAYQTPLVDLLFFLKIPVLSTSSASRIIVLASFSLAVLAAYGVDVMREFWSKRNKKAIVRWSLGVGGLFVLLWAVLLLGRPLPADKLTIAVRNLVLPTGFALLLVTGWLSGMVLPKRIVGLLPVFFVLLTGADMYRYTAKWLPFDPQSLVYPQVPAITALQRLTRETHARAFGNIGNEVGSAFGIPLIEGYDAVYSYRYGKLMGSASEGKLRGVDRSVVVFDKHGKYSQELLNLLGVRYYFHKKSDGRLPWAYPFWLHPGYVRVWEDEHFEILENTQSYPRVFLADSYVIADGEQSILDALYREGMDRRRTLVLETAPHISPSAGTGSATIRSYTANAVAIDVETSAPALLFLSDRYDKGWSATIDGSKTPLYRADYDFRAVAVPAGTHTVRMRYMPAYISWGFLISGFATLGLVIVCSGKKKT
jgi:hypothetical protein